MKKERNMKLKKLHAFNSKTGLLYNRESCKFDANTTGSDTELTTEQLAVVRATFENVKDTASDPALFEIMQAVGLASWQEKEVRVSVESLRKIQAEHAALLAVAEVADAICQKSLECGIDSDESYNALHALRDALKALTAVRKGLGR